MTFLKKCFESRTAAIVMMLLYAVLMALATVIEDIYTTETAKVLIYHSPVFILLQLLMVVNFFGVSRKYHLFQRRKWAYLLIHAAFIVILTGAGVTHFFSKEGMMSIREGQRSDEMVVGRADDWRIERLPFEVELLDFRLLRYPGSESPSAYESDLKVWDDGQVLEAQVYMNHVLDYKGYRFFQSSYDPDELGTILSVSHDAAGRTITYTGYVLLLLGLIGALFSRGGRFRGLLRELDKKTLPVLLLLALLPLSPTELAARERIKVPADVAAEFGHLPMQAPQGRIVPVNTFALDVLHKLQVESLPEPMDPDQFLLSLLADPSSWADVPLVRIDDPDLRKALADGREYISYVSAFDELGAYKYQSLVEAAYHRNPAERSLSDKELLKVDERLNILYLLFHGELVHLIPPVQEGEKWTAAHPLFEEYLASVLIASQSERWELVSACAARLSALQNERFPFLAQLQPRLDKEVVYNDLDLLKHVRRIYLIGGGLLLMLVLSSWFLTHREGRAAAFFDFLKIAEGVLVVAIGTGALLHAANMGLRWYISGHVPLSNAYETMVLLAWTTVLAGAGFFRKSPVSTALASIFGGVILFVSGLNWMDPQITPLVPVLKSAWLMFHVASMMVSYGFLGIGAVLALINLLLMAFGPQQGDSGADSRHALIKAQIHRLSTIIEIALMLGLVFMLVGIFLGAIWANESWGTYWSWDPKETWALITTVIYAALLHWRWFSSKRNDLVFNILSQWAILAVLMTYFGVNYLLSGMHAYGDTTLFNDLPVWIVGVVAMVFLLPGALAAFRSRRHGHSCEKL